MDGASAIAGLIGLGALTGQSATKIKKFVREYKESPRRLEDIQRWLAQVRGVLADIENSRTEIQNHGLQHSEILVANLEDSLRQCNGKIADFQADLAKQSSQKRLEKLKSVLLSAETESKRQEIDRSLKNVSRCCENLFRQLDLQSFPLLQNTSKQVGRIADEVSTLSATTQTLSADNEALREQLQSHAQSLSGDLGDMKVGLDKVNRHNDSTVAKFVGMENDIANIYGMAAVLPQELQSIIAQTVSQSVAAALTSLQQNALQAPPRGRILHRKIVPVRPKPLRYSEQGHEDLETVAEGALLERNVFKDFEIDKDCFEIDVFTQSKCWPVIGRMHANLLFGNGRGFSAIPQIKLTPSRFLFENNPLIEAIRTGDIGRVQVGFANNELCPLDIVADVPRLQGIESDLGLVEYAVNYQQLEIIRLLIEQGAGLDVTESSLTASMETAVFSNANRDKDVLRNHVDINRVLLKAGSRVEAIWVTEFYLFSHTWRRANLDVLSPICEEYWEDTFKLLWGPYESSHHLNSLTDNEGRKLSAIDEFLYDSYVLQRNENCDDPWAFRRLELALKFGAKVNAPSHYGNLSIQNFIARVSARFRHPGKGRWIEDWRTEHEGRNIFHSLLWLLHSGADPVAVDEHGQTATWLAFYCQLLPEWFAAIETHGVNAEYVARHAVSAVTQGFLDGLELVYRAPYTYEAIPLSGPRELKAFNLWADFDVHSVDEVRSLMREKFAPHGHQIYVIEDQPHEYGLLTTGVEFDLPSAPKTVENHALRKRLR